MSTTELTVLSSASLAVLRKQTKLGFIVKRTYNQAQSDKACESGGPRPPSSHCSHPLLVHNPVQFNTLFRSCLLMLSLHLHKIDDSNFTLQKTNARYLSEAVREIHKHRYVVHHTRPRPSAPLNQSLVSTNK